MKITTVTATPIKKNVHQVDARMIYNNESAQAVHMTLDPGQSLKPHITPVDVFFFVIEGTPDILIGEEKQRVSTNSLVESPKNIVHCIYNNTDAIVRILVVKVPRPTMATKVL